MTNLLIEAVIGDEGKIASVLFRVLITTRLSFRPFRLEIILIELNRSRHCLIIAGVVGSGIFRLTHGLVEDTVGQDIREDVVGAIRDVLERRPSAVEHWLHVVDRVLVVVLDRDLNIDERLLLFIIAERLEVAYDMRAGNVFNDSSVVVRCEKVSNVLGWST